MKATIQKVYDKPREWQGQGGMTLNTVKVLFADGDFGEINCKPENAAANIEALTKLVGQEVEIETEGAPRVFSDDNYHKIKNYPGKPGGSGGGFGGGKQYVPAFTQTERGFWLEQERMDRRTALMQGVAVANASGKPESAGGLASGFYTWLRQTAGTEPAAAASGGGGSHTPPNAPTTPADDENPFDGDEDPPGGEWPAETPLVAKDEKWPGPGMCPKCHAPEGKRHGRPCVG